MSSDAVCLDLQPHSYDGADNNEEEGYAGLKPASRRLAGEQPNDYFLWSLFNLLFLSGYCFCCLSFSALVFSIKARDRKVIGDPESAATYGKKARYLNIAACLIGIGITVTCFLAMILSAGNILKLFREMRENPNYYSQVNEEQVIHLGYHYQTYCLLAASLFCLMYIFPCQKEDSVQFNTTCHTDSERFRLSLE